jgi:hypothetical protein
MTSLSLTKAEIDSLLSLKESELISLLAMLPPSDREQVVGWMQSQSQNRNQLVSPGQIPPIPYDERSADITRRRETRSKAAEVSLRPIADLQRRTDCLQDPERFLRTYGAQTFYHPFSEHHRAMIRAIHERALTGGDKAVAAPRGDGKTQVATWMLVYILLACLVRFPMIVAATRKLAQKIFKQVQKTFAINPLIVADFPEICDCVLALEGAPQRASKQHVAGRPTRIIWTQDEIGFPDVIGSPYGNRFVSYCGLDSAIRGISFSGVRPDFALIDDPETREVAFSDTQHHNVEEMIDGDIALLCGPDKQMTRVVLTTIQNRRCYSYRVTDRTSKPAFAGDRYGSLLSWPENLDLWREYIAIRQKNQEAGDKDGEEATAFYLSKREEMQTGAKLANPYRYISKLKPNGEPIEVDGLQSFFNKVADLGMSRVNAELQNQPDEEEAIESIGLTAGRVAGRISGLRQNELPPAGPLRIVVGCDVGKYFCHWVKIAFYGNAIGSVLDYGIAEVPGTRTTTSQQAIERAIFTGLLQWRTDILAENPPEFCLIDSGGEWGVAIYEFCREAGSPFASAKGYAESQFQLGQNSVTRRTFLECWAGAMPSERIWLYHHNSEFWKQWVHERFNTPTFDDQHQRNDGAISLYASEDPKRHLSYSHHIVAEERQEIFVPGKGLQRKWVKINKNNHYLDATALACCAAGIIGVRVVSSAPPVIHAPAKSSTPQEMQQRSGNLNRGNGKGWVNRR